MCALCKGPQENAHQKNFKDELKTSDSEASQKDPLKKNQNRSSSISYRTAEVKDFHSIVSFQLAMALETENLRLDLQTCQKGVQAVFDDVRRGVYYVAEKESRVIGSLLLIPEWSDWRNGVVLWIHSVYIESSERGRGVFRGFYEMVKQLVVSHSEYRGLRLYVDKRNDHAKSVYHKIGMRADHYELFEWLKDDSSAH